MPTYEPSSRPNVWMEGTANQAHVVSLGRASLRDRTGTLAVPARAVFVPAARSPASRGGLARGNVRRSGVEPDLSCRTRMQQSS